jgi:hypothetical protein
VLRIAKPGRLIPSRFIGGKLFFASTFLRRRLAKDASHLDERIDHGIELEGIYRRGFRENSNKFVPR